jgi:uncharacterized protein with PQ loop repeat
MYSDKGATVLATLGTVCWCVQLIPQIIQNYRRKNCEGFPPLMMFLWAACGIPFAIYFISTRANIAVQIQPCLFFFFCLVAWFQSLYYPPVQLPWRRCLVYAGIFVAVAIGMDVGFILWLRGLYDDGISWPTLIFGVLASVLLAIGLVPPYFELAKRRGRVVGINFIFLGVDLMGATLSMLSVVVGNMDIMGISLYGVCMALEIGIFTSHFIWWLRLGRKHVEEEEKDEDSLREVEIELVQSKVL